MVKGRGLGKGLASLLPAAQGIGEGEGEITMLAIDRILPNPFQPRKEINENTLTELADSIRVHGVIQPLIVRRNEDGDYWIVAGERRWMGAGIAGLTEVPVRVVEGADMEMREISLIENIQREDLSPVDIALSLSELMNSFNTTQEELASSIGWSRAAVTNKLRLLQLPEEIRILLRSNELTEGHCRALLALESSELMLALARDAVQNRLSVRQVEELVQRAKSKPVDKKRKTVVYEIPTSVAHAAQQMGLSIKVTGRRSKMKLHVEGVREDLLHDMLQFLEDNAEKYFPGNIQEDK